MDDVTGRNRQILEAIIEDYINTAEPVGSRAVTRRHGLNVSPATVRNVMSDLEEMGFLSSPHTSAGRIPTEKAYRFYVNTLLGIGKLSDLQQEGIAQSMIKGKDVSEILKEATRMLSSLSHYMGIVLAPRFNDNVLRHLEFVKLGGRRILVIMVSDSGIVQNKLVEWHEELASEDLVRMSNYLNDLLQGLAVTEVKRRLVEEMQNGKALFDSLMSKALRISEEGLAGDDVELFVEGQANILEQPEFADVERMKNIFRTFEEKNQLLELLSRCLDADGVQIFIGSEAHLSRMEDISIITSTYASGHKKLGVLGVIGPTRMGYSHVIPIVDYTARLVSKLLEQ